MEIQDLILRLEGAVLGFPDTPRKLDNVTRAWAEFVSLEPHHVKFNPATEPYMTEEDKVPYMWREGIVPGEWLIQRIRQTCKYMPSPVEAREIYWAAGFRPVDGQRPQRLDSSTVRDLQEY